MRPVRVAVAGSVDDGKSTLLGRLMSDAELVFTDEVDAVRRASRSAELNLAFFTDGLTVERERGITLDVAWRHLTLGNTRLLLADVPGHAELVRNMATGASTADAALLLVDAARGVQPQTRRHLVMLAGLGVATVIVVLNKMDAVGYSRAVADQLTAPLRQLAGALGLELELLPCSALLGENVVHRSERLAWFTGPTVAERLATIAPRAWPGTFRAAVQLPSTATGWTALHVLGGELHAGAILEALPSGASVRVLEVSPTSPSRVRLDVALARGELLAAPGTVQVEQACEVIITCLERPSGVVRLLQHGRATGAALTQLRRRSLETGLAQPADRLEPGDVAEARLRLDAPTWLCGEALLIDDAGRTVAGVRFPQ